MGSVNIYLPLSDLRDKEEERLRLQQKLEEVESQIGRLTNLLDGPFAQKAPPQVVEKERNKLEGYQKSRHQIVKQIDELN